MDWISIGLAGVIGAISAGIAMLIVRNYREKRMLFAGVMVGILVLLNSVSNAVVRPYIDAWQIRTAILNQPIYAALAQDDPQLYAEIEQRLTAGISSGKNTSEMTWELQQLMGEVAGRYQSRAPDDAVIGMTRIIAQNVKELEQDGSDLCYQILFPNESRTSSTAPTPASRLRPEMKEDLLRGFSEVITRGAKEPTPPMESELAEPLLEEIGERLFELHGEDAQVLTDLTNPAVDRRLACRVSVSFFEEILSLPKEEAGGLLRYLYSQ